MYAYSSRVNSPDIDGFRVMLQPQNFSPAQCPPVSSSQAAGVSHPDGSLSNSHLSPSPTKHSPPRKPHSLPCAVTHLPRPWRPHRGGGRLPAADRHHDQGAGRGAALRERLPCDGPGHAAHRHRGGRPSAHRLRAVPVKGGRSNEMVTGAKGSNLRMALVTYIDVQSD